MHVFCIQDTRHNHRKTQAEVKILTVICYFFVALTLANTSDSFFRARSDVFAQSAADYLMCESTGVRESRECDRGEFERVDLVVLRFFSLFFFGFIPAIILMYVVNVGELKRKWRVLYASTEHAVARARNSYYRKRPSAVVSQT